MKQQNPEDRVTMRRNQWEDMFARLKDRGWDVVSLYENGAPNYDASYGQPQPRLAVKAQPGKGNPLVVVLAGGGFQYKTYSEAEPTAEFFLSNGFAAAILDYRVNPYTREDCLNDARQCLRLLRRDADKYGIDKNKIAVCGYSAGGMLAGNISVFFDEGDAAAPEGSLAAQSCRPDAAVLCYGSMATSQGYGPLVYSREKQKELYRYSSEKHLREDCPPFFLFQTASDDPRHMAKMVTALTEAGIPVEAHLFAGGVHGGGLYDGRAGVQNVPATAKWAPLCVTWLRGLKF